jgi:HSP20 family molecular chaperone IbpA
MYPGSATKKEFDVQPQSPVVFENGKDVKTPVPVLLSPAVNIWETPALYRIVVAVPGLRREDFNIIIEQGVLSISARKEAIYNDVQDLCEYDYTDWNRSFALPGDADAMLTHAKYANGELIIRIPRGNTTGNAATTPVYVY